VFAGEIEREKREAIEKIETQIERERNEREREREKFERQV
jgi:hypothetical protein